MIWSSEQLEPNSHDSKHHRHTRQSRQLRPVFLSLAFAHLQPSSASPILSTLSDETRPS